MRFWELYGLLLLSMGVCVCVYMGCLHGSPGRAADEATHISYCPVCLGRVGATLWRCRSFC